jgi:hypothetical protein
MATVAHCRLMSAGQNSQDVVTVTTAVRTRHPVGVLKMHLTRWVVVATFVGVDGSEPRCVDYRVRVVPEVDPKVDLGWGSWDGGSLQWAFRNAATKLGEKLADNAITPDEVAGLGEIPAEGIPRYVFEEASQARMLVMAREYARTHFATVSDKARDIFGRQSLPKRRGRPPVRSMGEKLRILADVERLPTLQAVADAHVMSRSAVRDLVSWARHDADPPLFTAYGPGRRGGELTEHARAWLAQIEQESS